MDLSRSLTSALDVIELKLLEKRAMLSAADKEDTGLQELVRSFGKPHKPQYLVTSLSSYQFSGSQAEIDDFAIDSEWLVLAKACVIVVRSLVNELFERSLPLSEDILYWEQLLSSRRWRALYFVQTLPSRLYSFGRAVVGKLLLQFRSERLTLGTLGSSVFDQALFRRLAFPHLAKTNLLLAPRLLSLDTVVKQEVRTKLDYLRGLRDAQAQAIGLLVSQVRLGNGPPLAREVIYITEILEACVHHASQPYTEESNANFAQPISPGSGSPETTAQKLIQIARSLPATQTAFASEFIGRSAPSKLIRYWPIAIGGYFGSIAVIRQITANKAQITVAVAEMKETVSGFWKNWVLEPLQKILATIRHDTGSEVALMSSRSLSTDLDSLERMVVEFAKDNPQYSSSETLEDLKISARNGDLTPVLIAYENNIKSPLRSAITGSLIRALLIQIQKTKVDVEVAINGIDKLLKSQELVFGFVSVSPALVVIWFAIDWASRIRGSGTRNRNTMRLSSLKTLRNIDRLLCLPRADMNTLSYKRRGLILCEVQLLRQYSKCISSKLRHQYMEDVTDLERAVDLHQTQQVLARIFRIYAGGLA